MIKTYTLLALETAIHRALSLDDDLQLKLAPFQGKTIEIVVSPLDVHFFMVFEANKIRLLPTIASTANTTIHSSPMGLIRLSVLPVSKVRSLFNDQVTLSGDIELGQAVKRLFDTLSIDWEGHLAHFTGDVAAHQVARLFKKGLSIHRRVKASLKRNISEYLQEESQVVPPTEALEDFFHDVDNLVLDVERLEAKIALCKS